MTYTLDWEYIGEGYFGDYTGDWDDDRLMRFYLVDEDGNDVPDCSYCTLIRRDYISDEYLDKVTPIMVELITNSPNMKQECQSLSWLNDQDVMRMVDEY